MTRLDMKPTKKKHVNDLMEEAKRMAVHEHWHVTHEDEMNEAIVSTAVLPL